MYDDNMRTLHLSGTAAFSSRTEPRYHFLRELVASNKIIVSHVRTTDQLADIFTKFLDYPKFNAILDNQLRFLSYSTRSSSTFASSLVLRGVCLLFYCFLYALYVQRFVYVSDFVLIYTLFKSSLLAISTRYTRTWVFWKRMFWIIGLIYAKCLRRSPR